METAARLSRRHLLTGRLRGETAPLPIRPPWTDEAAVLDACTACGACLAACPEKILYADANGHPVVSFLEKECTFCGACADACPEPVIGSRSTPAFNHRASIGASCFAPRGIHCQACGDACPEAAIRFRPRIGGPPMPDIAQSHCTGCGACVSVCPADAVSLQVPETAHD
ncbi:MAG: ferredoxin-type protein NapF [Rhodospirillales bacterium]